MGVPALMAKMPTERPALPPSTELLALTAKMPTEKHALLDSLTASTERPLLVPHALVDSVPALMAKMPTEKPALPPSTELPALMAKMPTEKHALLDSVTASTES